MWNIIPMSPSYYTGNDDAFSPQELYMCISVNPDGTPASYNDGCTCMFEPYDWVIEESGPPNALQNDSAWVRNDSAWIRHYRPNVIAVRRRSGFELDGR
ncbi:hypothetical protein FO519_003821 [Halicephalobus sp. NKZ332]|nr:hypothetical protein FO519_003821 [Halicephalobus sp. NKZ332]